MPSTGPRTEDGKAESQPQRHQARPPLRRPGDRRRRGSPRLGTPPPGHRRQPQARGIPGDPPRRARCQLSSGASAGSSATRPRCSASTSTTTRRARPSPFSRERSSLRESSRAGRGKDTRMHVAATLIPGDLTGPPTMRYESHLHRQWLQTHTSSKPCKPAAAANPHRLRGSISSALPTAEALRIRPAADPAMPAAAILSKRPARSGQSKCAGGLAAPLIHPAHPEVLEGRV